MAFCSRCGAKVADGSAFCSACGASLSQTTKPQAEKPSAGTKRGVITLTSANPKLTSDKVNAWAAKNGATIINVTMAPPKNGWHTATVVYEVPANRPTPATPTSPDSLIGCFAVIILLFFAFLFWQIIAG